MGNETQDTDCGRKGIGSDGVVIMNDVSVGWVHAITVGKCCCGNAARLL